MSSSCLRIHPYFVCCCLAAFFIPFLCLAQEFLEDPLTQARFPLVIAFNDKEIDDILQATGVASRTKFFVKVYSIAHYWQHPLKGSEQEIVEAIFQDGKAKQFIIRWLRDIPLEKVRETFYDTFQNILPENDRHHLQKDIDRFLTFYDEDVQKNEQHGIRWLPGGHIQLWVDGKKKGELTSVNFAKALWNIWLGPKSVVNRQQLLSLIITNQ